MFGRYILPQVIIKRKGHGDVFAKMQSAVDNGLPKQEKRPGETILNTTEPRQDGQQAAQQAKEGETPPPNDRMVALRADMAKAKWKEPMTVGYFRNTLKVEIPSGDNFDTAFARLSIQQQADFAKKMRGMAEAAGN